MHSFNDIISNIISNEELTGLNITALFDSSCKKEASIAANLSVCFLIRLSGNDHPLYAKAIAYMNGIKTDPLWRNSAQFFEQGISLIQGEVAALSSNDRGKYQKITDLCSWLRTTEAADKTTAAEKIRSIFSPESAGLLDDRNKKITALRDKRSVTITKLNSSPITNPAEEILFTSNILITVPPPSKEIDNLKLTGFLKKELHKIIRENQIFWYDHPVPIGISQEHNEVLYGLEGLDRAVEFEKERGAIHRETKVSCVLSVSVTHKGLQRIVKKYLEDGLKKEKSIRHLEVYVITEADTLNMINDILVPFAESSGTENNIGLVHTVFGVDGEYGRHYSFLKAVAAFWQVFINPGIKGTFKIDLDQVFPQKELVEQSGSSAFDHFKTPLWGAEGIDSSGSSVELGMIAGALVNQNDFHKGIFTPDVTFPEGESRADELIFFSTLPQALSTKAEMMTRYTEADLDGKSRCIQRIHVTGGTNGILVDSLRKYRPFTPTFIGRAEDQAYILSVLFDGAHGKLRYVHKDGLIMRHDKEAFAVEAIQMAAAGKLVGDYVRTLMFSYYAKALPWSVDDIKHEIDPFTGCFVSKMPITVVYLRFVLKLTALFSDNSSVKEKQKLELFKVGTSRLHQTIQNLTADPNPLIAQYNKEKQGWKFFYDILEKAEEKIQINDPFAVNLQSKAVSHIENCKIRFK